MNLNGSRMISGGMAGQASRGKRPKRLRLTVGSNCDPRPFRNREGARSELKVEMEKNQYDLKEYIASPWNRGTSGWGKVTIPADVNSADNDYYFAFERPAPRRAVIVVDDGQIARPLQLAASIAPDPAVQCSAEVLSPDQLGTVEWEKLSLLLWQAPLPEGDTAQQVSHFVSRGGYALFLPPRVAGPHELFGATGQPGSKVRRRTRTRPPFAAGIRAAIRTCSLRRKAVQCCPSANCRFPAIAGSR